MPEIKLPPEVVAAFDTLEAGQSLDLANAFVREDGMLLATIKVHGRPSKLWTPAVVSPYTLTSQIRLGTIYKDRDTGRAVQPVAVDYADGAFIYVEALDEHGDIQSGIIYGVEASDLLPYSEEEYWEQYDSPATCLEFSATCKASPAHPLKVLHASHPNLILELLDECKTDDEALCLVRQNPTLFRRRIQAINETVDKIKALLSPPVSTDWRPISTAPTDGTQLLLCWPTLCREPLLAVGAFNGQWEPDESRFTGKQLRENPPTHWCPLPPPAITKDKA